MFFLGLFTSLTDWYIVNTYLFLLSEIAYIAYDPLKGGWDQAHYGQYMFELDYAFVLGTSN